MSDEHDSTRRRFLKATGAASATAAIAGCSTGGDGGTTTGPGGTTATTDGTMDGTMDTTEGTDTTETTTTEPPGENELTAEDFVYSFRRLAESENSNRADFILGFLGVTHETDSDGNVVPESLGVEATDTYELTITLEQPFASSLSMLAYSAFSAVPEGVVGDVEGYDGEMAYGDFATSNPVGCGPFSFGEWTQGEEVFFERFDDYHGEVAPQSEVHWAVIEDSNASYNYFINENADIGGVPTAQYSREKVDIQETDDRGRQIGTYGPLQNDKTVNYARIPEVSTFYIGFNCESVEMPVRKAMANVVNMQEFVTNIFKDRSAPAYHLTPPAIFPGGLDNYDQHYRGEGGYPYGIGETRVEEARRVMENAGYGPDDRYELNWLQYRSPAYEEMANVIRSRLEAAHIDMNISKSDFIPLINQAQQGNVDAFTLGWIADYPAPDNFLQLADPPRTNYRQDDATGAYLYWTEDSFHGEGRQQAIDAFDRVENNPEPSESAQEIRNEAYLDMEEAIWQDVPMILNTHGIGEPMWYDRVDWPLRGEMGFSRQKKNAISVEGRDRLSLINATISTFDPIASTDTAGGEVIMQVFDALTNYRNGTTAVEALLADDFSTNDDFTEYTFQLKEEVQFHPQ